MRVNVKPRPDVAVKPEIRALRPPDSFIDIISKNELEFRKYIADVESSQIFSDMVSNGLVRKVGFRGRIPSYIYQEYQDREFINFLNKYKIEEKIDWESDFFDKKALKKVIELSKKYNTPKGELVKALEYCRHRQLSWDGIEEDDYTSSISLDDDEKFYQIEDPELLAESDEYTHNLAKLIEKHEISEQDFIEYFLSGNVDAFDIARELDLGLDDVEEIIDAVEKVNIINSMQVNIVESQVNKPKKDIKIIATIKKLENPPRAEIQIEPDEEYSCRYKIKSADDNINADAKALLDKLRMINQRRSLTFRITHFIYQYQYAYFVGLNPCHLKPLSQAQIAREMGEHESTISRILRNKYIETENGVVPYDFFCQSKGDIIERLIKVRETEEINANIREKPFSDAEIAEILEKEYGVRVSRRTVTYYRNKTSKTPKFYSRKKTLKKNPEKENHF